MTGLCEAFGDTACSSSTFRAFFDVERAVLWGTAISIGCVILEEARFFLVTTNVIPNSVNAARVAV